MYDTTLLEVLGKKGANLDNWQTVHCLDIIRLKTKELYTNTVLELENLFIRGVKFSNFETTGISGLSK